MRAKTKIANRGAVFHRPSKDDRRLAEKIVEAIGRADAEWLLKILTKMLESWPTAAEW